MKIITELEAIKLIKDNDTLGISSQLGWGVPEALLKKLEEVYHQEKHPKNITLSVGVSPGTFNYEKLGTNHLTEEGLIGKLISAHVGAGREIEKCISNNQFPTYTIPLGIYGKLLRAIAAKEIGYLSHVGLNTFADPRLEGCKANQKSTEDIVELVKIGNKEQLLYKSYPINICFIKASYIDKEGNVSLIEEPLIGEQAELAAATHNSGGIVVVQVSKIVKHIKAKEVAIHKSLVDYVVVCKDVYSYNDDYSKYCKELVGSKQKKRIPIKTMELNTRKVCGRRAALELEKNDVINLGVGMPESVASIAREEGIYKNITLSIEMGPLGGIPLGGTAFGAALNPEAVMSITNTMDLYAGGFLDMTILGLAEVDKNGNVNVSKFNGRTTGPGGFIDISQTTRKVIFVGTFTSVNLKEKIENDKLIIIQEGKISKFKNQVEQITFSAKTALRNKQKVLYVTERAVFQLTEEGLILIEIAPGIDLHNDILANMEFEPKISKDLKLMDKRIFNKSLMGLEFEKKSSNFKKIEHTFSNLKNYLISKKEHTFIEKV